MLQGQWSDHLHFVGQQCVEELRAALYTIETVSE